jgi:hypothetical protein
MEKMKNIFTLLLLLGFYSPAHGEILIYQKTIKGFDCNAVDDVWDVYQRKHRGYLVLEIEYEYDVNDVLTINVLNAKQIDYFKVDDDKWYEAEDHYFFEVKRADFNGKLMWFLTETIVERFIDIKILMLQGPVVDSKIGLGKEQLREIPKKLKGNNLYDLQLSVVHLIDTWDITLRLNSQWTGIANNPNRLNGNFDDAVADVEVGLINKGYEDRS